VNHLLRDHIETISSLTDEEFAYILSHFVLKKVKKHAFLIQEGDPVRYEYFVLKGCLKAYVADTLPAKNLFTSLQPKIGGSPTGRLL
jgi:CRP-like cAMP-binding protein